jgi:hypothetical protein
VRDPSSSLGRSIFKKVRGPEAHKDEFSTFNRAAVGSIPTRPTKWFAREAHVAAHGFGKAGVVSSILTAGPFVTREDAGAPEALIRLRQGWFESTPATDDVAFQGRQ